MAIFRRYANFFARFDWLLFGAVFLLLCFGLSALYSIAMSGSQPDFANFKKQILFGLLGLIIGAVFLIFDYRRWRDHSYILYPLVAILLILVLFIGTTISGTKGWFSFFGFTLQPVEFAKIALIMFLSWYFNRYGEEVRRLRHFLISGAVAAGLFGLVLMQPDFGSAMMLFTIWFLMAVFAGVNKKYVLILLLLGMVSGLIAWQFLFQDYQRQRIFTFFDPQRDPYGRGYHVRQAVTAVGAGGLFGRGLGSGSQSQLKFIPASQTDFIFAVIAEELGFLGVTLILFIWAIIFYRLIRAVRAMRDYYASLFIFGVSAMLFSHVAINIGMNIGIVPVTGISLPFLSYGGSFLITSIVLVGIVEGMIIKNRAYLE